MAYIGTFRGMEVTWDGTTVRCDNGHGITRDFELNGNFRWWLAARGVVLP